MVEKDVRWLRIPGAQPVGDEVAELARRIMCILCEERPGLGNQLESSAIYERLRKEGVALPGHAMHDAFDRLGAVRIDN